MMPFSVPAAADALIVHVPGAIFVTVVPLTRHTVGVITVYTTGRPDDVVAANGNVVASGVSAATGGKLIVCALMMLISRLTSAAASYDLSPASFKPPACDALMVHFPGL